MKNSKRRQGCFGWTTRLAAWTISLLLVLTISGLVYQKVASWRDRQAYPLPGRMVDIGSYRLHLHCLGTGEPTVVLEAGLPMSSLHWSPVLEALAKITTVCAYDRAGLGWSEPSPDPLKSEAVADQLHNLLANADIPGPYILVGHSIGGLHVRTFARRYPAEVRGIILVDSSHENQNLRLPPIFTLQQNPRSMFFCRILAPLGILRLLNVYEEQLKSTRLSVADWQKVVANRNQTHFCMTQHYEESAAEIYLTQPTPPIYLGDLPVIVISAGLDLRSTNPTEFPFPVNPDELIEADQVQRDLQKELASLSTNSIHIIAEDSGHNIHHDQPELVIDAVQQLIQSYTQ